MKRVMPLLLLALLLAGCALAAPPEETTTAPTTIPETLPLEATVSETTLPPVTFPTLPPLTLPPEPVYFFSEEEQTLLLKIGMAELGNEGCTECVALVMRTILNRVESDRFVSTIRSVLYAQDQFTPVMDGTFDQAEPNQLCYDALEMIIYGWDESQGALYYEFCDGPSWHSQNLNLLTEHCNTRFYD